MRATELMLGDYIYDLYGNKAIVRKLDDYNEHAKASGVLIELVEGAEEGETFCLYGEIEPIRITPEILEKNGFVLREGCTTAWDWHSDDYSVHVSGNNEQVPMTLTIYVPSGWSRHGSRRLLDDLSVSYVHKLQHALRLCGVNKEIKL